MASSRCRSISTSRISLNFTQSYEEPSGRIRNARFIYERDADEGPVWWDESDPEEDAPDEIERSRRC
jgi:hypothetical protein